MKVSELKIDDVIAITYGAMFPDSYVLITTENLAGEKALGMRLDESAEIITISRPSDYRSANGSPIGSWHKLDDKFAAQVIAESEEAARS